MLVEYQVYREHDGDSWGAFVFHNGKIVELRNNFNEPILYHGDKILREPHVTLTEPIWDVRKT